MSPRLLALGLVAATALACGDSGERASDSVRSGAGDAQAEAPAPARRERPLPAFSGSTLDHRRLSVGSLLGKRLLIYFFNPEVAEAEPVTEAVNAVAALRGEHNFSVLGIAVGSNALTARRFVAEQGVAFDVIDDSNAAISGRLGLRAPLAVLGADAEGYLKFAITQFQEDPERVEHQIRRALRLPVEEEGPLAGRRPMAPDFRAEALDAEAPFELSAHRGRPVVLTFFLHTCPHCHEALGSLKSALAEIPEERRPLLVGVEISGRTHAVRAELRRQELDFFPVVFDRDESIRRAYGSFGYVPDTFLIDAQGRVAAHVQGWRSVEDPPLMRMRLAQLAGAPLPMLLRKVGYSGSEVCGVCHEAQHETWAFTTHASAYDTLVKHGADANPECVGCHVVGWQEPGGFSLAEPAEHLEDVGCESCHGRGGPHLSPDFVAGSDYESACVGCHDQKHSLGFEYATFVPRVSHAANLHLTGLPLAERQRLLADRGRPGGALLPTSAEYVGSEACAGCHAAEHETWAQSAHARSLQSLEQKGQAGDAECLACHTTAYGRPGGFPEGASPAAHADLARVGCESCHGPGGDHAAAGAEPIGTIVSLGDKCDSCVILQICGSCHDEANDPGFEFEVQAKIEKQRHGTIEPGTGRAKPTSALRGGAPHPTAALVHAWPGR